MKLDDNNVIKYDFHTMDAPNIFKIYNSSDNGLNSFDLSLSKNKFGLNEITEAKSVSPILALIAQFNNILTYILLLSAGVSIYLGKTIEPIAIIVIVILAGVTGFIQEFQASKAISSLKKMASPFAKVIRDGIEVVVPASEIYPGDIILVSAGDKIPADARVIDAINLKIDEAMLTGESSAVTKHSKVLSNPNLPIGDRKNILYSGSAVTYGRGKAVVVSTGMNTEFGKIAQLIANTEDRKTPLQVSLDTLAKQLGIFSIVLATAVSVFDYLKGATLAEVFLWGVALAVAIIPEALPAVVTITLALGVRRMVKRKALIRKLPAVETLGATNIICSDKTGTLTQDQMTIRKIFAGGAYFEVTGIGYAPIGKFKISNKEINPNEYKDLIDLLSLGTLCSDASLSNVDNEWTIIGDPTEAAIVVAAQKANLFSDKLKTSHIRLREIPFSSETKRMTTVNKFSDVKYAISKGAPEVILHSCTHYVYNGEIKEMTKEFKNIATSAARSFAENALRVIGIAFKRLESDDFSADHLERSLIFSGFVGMIDPPREEVKDAIRVCERAGIKPIMITGDHKTTAVAVAKELGILKSGLALSGEEVENLNEQELDKTVVNTEVFARISPTHKLKIVEAFIRNGNIVAMTGDGVNDAPSLKRADIGIAMGITGTDVSKEASDMILTDDNFASIIAAVEEGRSIYENIRKYLVYLLGGNMGAVFGLVVALLAGFPVPLLAVHILFINFIMDGILAITLGLEPPEKGVMNKKPRSINENIISKKYVLYIGSLGAWIAGVCLIVFIKYGGAIPSSATIAESYFSTLFYATLISSRIFAAFTCRSLDESFFKYGFKGNKYLVYGAITVLLLSAFTIQSPLMNPIFNTSPLSIIDWIVVVSSGMSVIIFSEIYKWIRKII